MHFNAFLAVAFARFAPSPSAVEAEAGRAVTAHLGLGQVSIQFTNLFEDAGVGGWIGSWRAAQRLLIDLDDLVDLFQPHDFFEGAGLFLRSMQAFGDCLGERFFDKRTLAGTRDPCDDGECSQRDSEVDVAQVVHAGAEQFQPAAAGSLLKGGAIEQPALLAFGCSFRGHPARIGDRDFFATGEVLPGERRLAAHQLFGRSLSDDSAAKPAGPGAEIIQPIGFSDHFTIVLDQNQRVAQILQLFERLQQTGIVAGVESDGGFVQDVEDAGQCAANLSSETDALAFAPR